MFISLRVWKKRFSFTLAIFAVHHAMFNSKPIRTSVAKCDLNAIARVRRFDDSTELLAFFVYFHGKIVLNFRNAVQ